MSTRGAGTTTSNALAGLPGRLVVLSGPSGVGKTVVSQRLVAEAGAKRVVTATSRAPRAGEKEGVDYYFLTRERFRAEIEKGGFLEYASVHGNFYGTPLEPVRRLLVDGATAMLVIDVQGAETLMEKGVAADYVFLMPPSEAALETRLRARGSDDDPSIRLRLENAKKEMAQSHRYAHRIVNDDLDRAVGELKKVLGL